jgi:hypothetical protein
VIEVMSGLLVAGCVLLVLRVVAELCWRAFDVIATALFERGQLLLYQRRVETRCRVLQQAFREEEQRAVERFHSRRIVDLDGQQRTISQDGWFSFLNLCLAELQLEASLSTIHWHEIRKHWRRRSLSWHPDRGGSVQIWLRKQRAYEALEVLLPLWREQLDRHPIDRSSHSS